MDPIEKLTKDLEAAVAKAGELSNRLNDGSSSDDVKKIRAEYDETKSQVATLLKEKEDAERNEEIKALRKELDDLKGYRSPRKHEFSTDRGEQHMGKSAPFGVLLYRARRGDQKAVEALEEIQQKSVQQYIVEGKALGEGVTTAGGYLVPPQFLQDLVALRRASSPMRDFITVIPGVKTSLIYIPQQTGVSSVAWTAENAPKTSTDEVLGQIAVNIFTLAGIAKVSKQLVEDSSPAVDAIIRADLGRGLAIEEDRAIINGSGTGQPTGILNTAGVVTTAASAGTAAAIYDDILAAVGRIQATYYGQPDAVLMHPRTWAKMLTAKDSAGRFLGLGTVVGSQTFNLPGVTSPTGAMGGGVASTTIFGIPLIIDANMPTALTVGGNSNRSAVIVGAFREAWLFERDGVTMDVSDEAGTSFEQNQVWFRGEERAGFTAARLPSAFQIVSDESP